MSSHDVEVNDFLSLPLYKMIELPALTKSTDIALTHLGGLEHVHFSLSSGVRTLPFKLSNSPSSAALQGTLQTTSGLLLKVLRNKRTKESKIIVIGRIENCYKFDVPADYQVICVCTAINIISCFIFV
jgi:hypothetical protein